MQNLFIVGGISIAIVAIFVVFDYLKSKGVNVGTALKEVGEGVKTAEGYTEAAIGLTTGKLKNVLEFTDVIEKLAITGIGKAEDMYLAATITNDPGGNKRRESALNYIYTALEKENIVVDEKVKSIAEGIVRNTAFSDKNITDTNARINDLIQEKVSSLNTSNANLQKQITTLTADNTKLKTENAQLEQKLTTIQSTAGTNTVATDNTITP